MNFTVIIRSIVEKTLGTVIRHGLSGFGVWLAAKGVGSLDAGTQTNLADLAIGSICVLIPALWSVIRAHITSKQISDLTGMASKYGFFGMRKDDIPNPPPSIKADPLSLVLWVSFLSAAMMGCSVVSNFDQNTYNSASLLKSESMALVSCALEPAVDHQEDIDALKVKLSAQLAYEQGKGKANAISAKQWEILISTDHDLLGKLLQNWEAKKKFSQPYLTEKTQQISDGFDQILKLEGRKIR